ncbi:MAG: NAD(P)H-dependent oxidoreductase [Pyrinomonadaceae bacterium]|nr:NAD(P)H-dependent oxidoreductase [Pyrinomonadaceae bacterium]
MSKLLAFSGSLRKESTNTKTLAVAVRGAQSAGADVNTISLMDYELPLYNGDIEASDGIPQNAAKLQELMLESDGFLIASPEYNSSITGALKNMIDWTSRPNDGRSAGASFAGKSAALMSASPGGLGGLRGLFDVRKILSTMGVIVLPAQVAVSQSYTAFDENGEIIDEKMRSQVEGLGAELATFADQMNK